MLSRTGVYAVRAVAFLVDRQVGTNVTAAEIACALAVPRNYLSKVMNALVHAGVVAATPGPHGGFRLAQPPDQVTLLEVLTPFEGGRAHSCMLGLPECESGAACPDGDRCRTLSAEIDEFLRTTPIVALVTRRGSGRERAAAGQRTWATDRRSP